MPNETARSAARLCRREAHLTHCSATRTALLSLARALERAQASEQKEGARHLDPSPGSSLSR
jgi:hypothetical protein